MKFLPLIVASFIGLTVFSQEKIKAPIHSSEAYERYVTYTSEENYEAALNEVNSIQVGDSNYLSAQLDKALCLLKLERFDEAIEVCKRGMNLPYNPYQNVFRLNWGYALNAKEDRAGALKVYQELQKDYPFYISVNNNIAALYLGEEQYDKSYEEYKRMARLFPFDVSAHYNLALFAYHEGHLTEAFMAFNMFLLLEPYSDKALTVLQLLNEISNNSKSEKTPKEGFKLESKEYEEIDLLIDNYVALSKKYKVPGKSQLYIAKQNHLIFSQLLDKKNSDYFFSSFYEPFFEKVMEEGWFEQMQLMELLPSKSEVHQKMVNKGMKDISAFNDWFRKTWYDMNKVHEINYKNLKGKHQIWYYDNGAIQSIGNTDKSGQKNLGEFCFFNQQAVLLSSGAYGEEGKIGTWEYYQTNGNLNQKLSYINGQVTDTVYLYNKAGTIDQKFGYKNDKREGFYEEYYRSGSLYRKGTNKNGELDGEMTYYFKNGNIEYKVNYVDGKLQGKLQEFYSNGKLYREEEFADGKASGSYKLFWVEGTKRAEGTKKDGAFIGNYKSYFRDGKVEEEGNLIDGKEEGEWKEYYSNGNLSKVTQYSKGKLEGITQYYDKDGVLYSEKGFKNGYMVSYKFLDKEGKVLSEAASKKKQYTLENYHPNGTLSSRGDYKAEVGYVGSWESFDSYGNLEYKYSYEDGALEGQTEKFYPWGTRQELKHFKKGDLDGYYVKYYSNGQMEEQGYYENGGLIGTWDTYYEDGTLKASRTYFNNSAEGTTKEYTVDGRLDFNEFYDEGVIMGGVYYDSLGNELNSFELKNGEGMYEMFHLNKQVAFKGKKILNSDEGVYQWYYSTGQLKSEGMNQSNNRIGKWKGYHLNGNVEYTGEYLNGGKEGEWIFYYEDGTKSEIEPYRFNELHGLNLNYHTTGKLQSETNYEYGESHGEMKFYDPNGVYQMSRVYRYGEIVGYFYYDAAQKKQEFTVENGNAEVRAKFPNGKPSRSFDLVKGYFHGPYKSYYENGQLSLDYVLKNDEREGTYKSYYEDGTLKLEQNYNNGQIEGVSKKYDEKGKLKETTTYKNGVKHGPNILYHSNGTIKKSYFYYDGFLYEK